MRLAVHFPDYTMPGGADRARSAPGGARRANAEDSGVLGLHRHGPLVPDGGSRARPRTRCSRATRRSGFLAAHTSSMTLGLLVSGVTYRHPGLLAKTVATLDVLSGGRAQLGIGAAWYEREHLALGVPFPPVGERFERLEEALQICRQMWSDDDGPYDGRHYHLAETICSPRPIQQPRPPILIGGGGEQKTLQARGALRRRVQPVHPRPRDRGPQARRCSTRTARPRGVTRPRWRGRSSGAATRSPTSTPS